MSPSGKQILLSCFYSIIIAATVSLGRPYAISICTMFPLCMGTNALEKSTNTIVASMFIARTPRMREIVKICDVVDRFLRKPVWLFLSIFSILPSRSLYSLAVMDLRVIPRLFLIFWGHPSQLKEVYCVLVIYTALQCRSRMLSNLHSFHISGGISSSLSAFLSRIFLGTESRFFFVNYPSLMSCLLLIIFVICSCVTIGGFPCKFSKCCFHSCIRSSWLVAFSLTFVVLFLRLNSFTVYYAIQDCLSSSQSLIFIWFCMCSVYSFRYT